MAPMKRSVVASRTLWIALYLDLQDRLHLFDPIKVVRGRIQCFCNSVCYTIRDLFIKVEAHSSNNNYSKQKDCSEIVSKDQSYKECFSIS